MDYLKNVKNVAKLVFISLFILIFSATPLFLLGCKKNEGYFSAVFFDADFSVATFDFEISSKTEKNIKDKLAELENEFSTCKDGFLSKFNSAEIGEEISISPFNKDVLEKVKECYEISNAFNPAILPLLKIWKFTEDTAVSNNEFVPPTEEEIENVLSSYSFNPLAFEIKDDVIIKKENVCFEFGGFIKGYAVDVAIKLLINDGHNSGYVNFGGSSIAIISANSIGVVNPDKLDENIIVMDKPKNIRLATSGNYRTFYEYGGEKYSHILSPETGMPSNTGIVSAVVFGNCGYVADALSTAFMVLDKESAVGLLRDIVENENLGVSAVFLIFNDGTTKQIITNLGGDEFSLMDNSYSVVKV